MPKYNITLCRVENHIIRDIEVEADSKEAATEKAWEIACERDGWHTEAECVHVEEFTQDIEEIK